MSCLYAIPLSPDPSRLHPRRLAPLPAWSAELAERWLDYQRSAHLACERGDGVVTMSARMVLAVARRLAVLESSNQALRQLRRVDEEAS